MTKSKLEIERPEWEEQLNTFYHDDIVKWFNNWFDTHVTPINKLLADGLTVYKQPGFGGHSWQENLHDASSRTHHALLINITPIKKETATDVLRDFMRECDSPGVPNDFDFSNLYKRAKAVLGEEC